MIYGIAFYVLVTGTAQLQIFTMTTHRGAKFIAAYLVGWFTIPARGLAKLVS